MMNNNKALLPKVSGKYTQNADLSKLNWFGVGGKADVLFEPERLDDLSYFLKNKPENMPVTILGAGSNVLIRDGGIRGVVIKLRQIDDIQLMKDSVEVGCGCLNSKLFSFCQKNGISGFEFLGTIPGTVGGSIKMNAGCFGSQISDILISVTSVDSEGNIIRFNNKDIGFFYRGNSLDDDIVFVNAVFHAEKGDSDKILEKFKGFVTQRNAAQPHGIKTAGSTFKNPEGYAAWKLIQEIDGQKLQVGDAKMSEKHANFMVNIGNAKAKDLEDLGEMIRKKVMEKSGVNLEWEVKRIGEVEV